MMQLHYTGSYCRSCSLQLHTAYTVHSTHTVSSPWFPSVKCMLSQYRWAMPTTHALLGSLVHVPALLCSVLRGAVLCKLLWCRSALVKATNAVVDPALAVLECEVWSTVPLVCRWWCWVCPLCACYLSTEPVSTCVLSEVGVGAERVGSGMGLPAYGGSSACHLDVLQHVITLCYVGFHTFVYCHCIQICTVHVLICCSCNVSCWCCAVMALIDHM